MHVRSLKTYLGDVRKDVSNKRIIYRKRWKFWIKCRFLAYSFILFLRAI